MDCFFAACECLQNPKLKNKPLIVGGTKESLRGVVCTASYEARQFGIHSAMPLKKAIKLCPQGIFIQSSHSLYRIESKKVMNVLQTFTHHMYQVSIDEAYLDITHLCTDKTSWMKIGKLIRKTVYEQTGFTCSVGISSSRKVSKIASDYQKPHGVTVVYNNKEFLAPLSIKKVPGIGKKTYKNYTQKGIRTIGDLAKKDTFFILDYFGKSGFKIWQLANGLDKSTIPQKEPEKSHSREHTFDVDCYSKNQLLEILQKLIQKTYNDLQKNSYKTVTLKIRYTNFQTITRSHTLKLSQNDKYTFQAIIFDLLMQIQWNRGIRLIGVKLDNLQLIKEKQLVLTQVI